MTKSGEHEINEMLNSLDALILGGGMYPRYEQYWLTNPEEGTTNHSAYAQRADKISHFVLSKTLDNAAWKTTRIIRDVEEFRRMKQQPGKDMLGGITLVSSLMNQGLIDELRLMINPLVLGGGKARHSLKLIR